MTDETNSRDELIDKLDHLINRGRVTGGVQGTPVPVLTEALPAVSGDPIPTLTEAVAGPGQDPERRLGKNELELLVAIRLAESIEREVSRLSGEFPTHREALGTLRKSVVKSLPELVRKAWSSPAEITGTKCTSSSSTEAKHD